MAPLGVTTQERRRIAELAREHRQLRRANELLKHGSPNTGAVGSAGQEVGGGRIRRGRSPRTT
jgi:hypothetical protein